MKIYEVKYGERWDYEREDAPLRIYNEIFILEDEDDPLKFIDKHYKYLSDNSYFRYTRLSGPTLISRRFKSSNKDIDYLNKKGEYIE